MLHLGSSLSLRSCGRLGSALSVLDLLHLGSALSLRSFSRLGSSISVLDFVHLGSALSLRSYARLGSQSSGNPRHFRDLVEAGRQCPEQLWCKASHAVPK